MKKLILLFSIVAFSTSVFAQSQTDSITLKDLEIPNAPGFMLMDNAPSLIERPTSSKAFAFSILNAIGQSNGIPTNYAIDVTPFWYFKHPNMTSYKYIGLNEKTNKQKPFAQFKKIALNFSYKGDRDTIVATPNHNFALGFRTTLIQLRSKKDITEIQNANDRCVENLRDIDDQLIKAGISYPTPIDTTIEYKKLLMEYFEAREKFISNLPYFKANAKNSLKDILARKPILAVDIAAGYNTSFIDNSFSQNQFGRFGSWITLALSQPLNPKKNKLNYINLYALGRYIIDGLPMDTTLKSTNYLDAGGKLELEFERIIIAYEFIYRANDIQETYRSNGIFKFKASSNIYLTAAFGKNFGTSNDLISMLGLNWGIGSGNEKTMIK